MIVDTLNLDAFTTGGGTGATYIISTGATGIPTKATVSPFDSISNLSDYEKDLMSSGLVP